MGIIGACQTTRTNFIAEIDTTHTYIFFLFYTDTIFFFLVSFFFKFFFGYKKLEWGGGKDNEEKGRLKREMAVSLGLGFLAFYEQIFRFKITLLFLFLK